MEEGRKPEYPEKTPGDELQKGWVLRLADPVSVYCGWVR